MAREERHVQTSESATAVTMTAVSEFEDMARPFGVPASGHSPATPITSSAIAFVLGERPRPSLRRPALRHVLSIFRVEVWKLVLVEIIEDLGKGFAELPCILVAERVPQASGHVELVGDGLSR